MIKQFPLAPLHRVLATNHIPELQRVEGTETLHRDDLVQTFAEGPKLACDAVFAPVCMRKLGKLLDVVDRDSEISPTRAERSTIEASLQKTHPEQGHVVVKGHWLRGASCGGQEARREVVLLPLRSPPAPQLFRRRSAQAGLLLLATEVCLLLLQGGRKVGQGTAKLSGAAGSRPGQTCQRTASGIFLQLRWLMSQQGPCEEGLTQGKRDNEAVFQRAAN
mmetsp:Transcript_5476/g.12664  ORF Transcript_5476/g.12664 Transcript_5476/m.12664 type:complete len:220 (+) Transcript_5476:411-1070(+)